MRLKYFAMWSYFYPPTCGSDRVCCNHFEYFRERGWSVDLIVPNDITRRDYAEGFRAQYPMVESVTEVLIPHSPWTLRGRLFAFEQAAQWRRLRAALTQPADLFFTNYVLSTPLVQHLPLSCKRVLESHDIMARQFSFLERNAASGGPTADPLMDAREAFNLRIELELYGLYDAVIMINADELRFVQSRSFSNAHYVPQMYEAPPAGDAAARAGDQFDLIFVGSGVPINVQGLTWFYRNVYVPYLWRHGVRLAIVGNVCNHLDIHDTGVTRLFQVEGPLDELYAASKLVIVPIFEGTGLSIKTLEGLAMRRAMVVTPKGARGLDDSANAYVKVDMQANPKHTADVILELLGDDRKREALQRSAAAYMRRCFSREAFFAAMDQVMSAAGLCAAAEAPAKPASSRRAG